MKAISLLLSLLLFSGCDSLGTSDSSKLILSTDTQSYQSGDQINLKLENKSALSFTIHPDLCGSLIQKKENNSWSPEHHSGACTAIAMTLKPGQSVSKSQNIASLLEPGNYRFKYSIPGVSGNSETQMDLYSREFVVR